MEIKNNDVRRRIHEKKRIRLMCKEVLSLEEGKAKVIKNQTLLKGKKLDTQSGHVL